MDLKFVENRLDSLALRKQAHKRFESTPDEVAINEAGKEVARQYKECGDGFMAIFDVADNEGAFDENHDLVTKPIVLAKVDDHPSFGKGEFIANLIAHDYETSSTLSGVETVVVFQPDANDFPEQPVLVARETFGADTFSFQGDLDFLDEDYNWYTWNSVAHGRDELEPIIRNAQETQAMLWAAIRNPELNPGLSQLSLELAQD